MKTTDRDIAELMEKARLVHQKVELPDLGVVDLGLVDKAAAIKQRWLEAEARQQAVRKMMAKDIVDIKAMYRPAKGRSGGVHKKALVPKRGEKAGPLKD